MSKGNNLDTEYFKTLQSIKNIQDAGDNDKYSGVFLPFPNEGFKEGTPKVMLVGRETGGWNTNNEKNTIQRIISANADNRLNDIIQESKTRYKKHLENVCQKEHHKSHFMRFHAKLNRKLGHEVFYTNLFAWDYDKDSPLKVQSEEDREMIIDLSLQLLSIQFEYFKPNLVIFATGVYGVDTIIKRFVNKKLGGFTNSDVICKRRLWKFQAKSESNTIFYRINHPRATDKKNQRTVKGSFSYCRNYVISEMIKLKENDLKYE